MNILLLKGYNNYFNRIVKREETISAYKSAVVDGNILNYYELTNANFNPNDGVVTELVVGKGELKWEDNLPFSSLQREGNYNPDYAIVYAYIPNAIEGQPPLTPIQSRWFVTECERTRHGQYRIALKRDVLADFKDGIMNSPCFVEKGTIDSTSNALLFNAEGMRFNEIKKDELLLKDETKVAWLVGYVKQDIDQDVTGITYTDPDDVGESIGDVSDLPFSVDCIEFRDKTGNVTQSSTKTLVNIDDLNSQVKFRIGYGGGIYHDNLLIGMTFKAQETTLEHRDYNADWQNLNSVALTMYQNSTNPISLNMMYSIGKDVINRCASDNSYMGPVTRFNNLKQDAITKPGNIEEISNEDLTDFFTNPEAVRYISHDNKTYRLMTSITSYSKDEYFTGNDSVANDLLNSLEKTYGDVNLTRNTDNPTRRKIRVEVRGSEVRVVAQEIELGATLTYSFPASSSRAQVRDAQYNIFAMPVMPDILGINPGISDDVRIKYDSEADELDIRSISRYQLAMANAIMTKLGGSGTASKAYDLQLLPYCPFNLDVYTADYPYRTVIDLDESGLTENFDYDLIKDGDDNVKGIILFARSSNFTKDIALPEISPNAEISLRNMEVREEVQVITNPTFKYNNQDYQGLPLFRMELPYKVADEHLTMDNVTLPSVITNGLVNSFISPLNTEGVKPAIYFTNSNMTGPYEPNELITFTDTEIQVLANWILPDNAVALKVENECDFQRLVSPNYNGMFQFKKARMNNGISLINVDCTYKPFTPYIKINPNFSGLYGRDWNDSTGLICAGDFSIPVINDPFINYALQNKNYQSIFARSIENLDVNQQIAKEQQQFQGIVGAITGGVGGAGAGALAGAKAGPYGAIAGAIVGGVGGTAAGTIGYNLDKTWLEKQQAEVRDYAIDNFNYQLGNIQALPQSISKSSPLSFNNKVWPILEFFSCTDEEKEVLKNKLKYDGMTIMAIGKLEDYLVPSGYVKGKMIRISNIKEDAHLFNAIYQEVDRGFYKGE